LGNCGVRESYMNSIAYFDIELNSNDEISDIGCVLENGKEFHKNSSKEFLEFIKNSNFLCGHNIIIHDIPRLQKKENPNCFDKKILIDTLYLSPLLFPSKPYHNLVKDYKLQRDEINNPLIDSIKAKILFEDELKQFDKLDSEFKEILYYLLQDKNEFSGFFKFISYESRLTKTEIISTIQKCFTEKICEFADINSIIEKSPKDFAYSLAIINAEDKSSITPPWVIREFKEVQVILHKLKNTHCNKKECKYCNDALDAFKGLRKYFGYDKFRIFNDDPLQEKAVVAAIENKSILVLFPTGGGKSITFQLPALLNWENIKGLTVVISPLQSLMKDQVDNLYEKDITSAVTINGLLDPIERGKVFEQTFDGEASILYISPESLRSSSIENLLIGRTISRFVIDEAHCFSAWGQDFRVDYQYIGDFIRALKIKKGINYIPISCFTATAKPQVVEDIRSYFKEKLSIELEIFQTNADRKNLEFEVTEKKEDNDNKYKYLRNLLDSHPNVPVIVYVSRTRKAEEIAKKLQQNGFEACAYHGKMDKQEKSKNQDDFKNNRKSIIVATSAFGMGVDKSDVEMVIHYDISDSLENYIQEAGRAGRNENIKAHCHIFFDENDLDNHFTLLNETKLELKEIKEIWQAIKNFTELKNSLSLSALEIAREAGWNDEIRDIETKVLSAVAALEDSKFIERKQNLPRVYANSILTKNASEAINKINQSEQFKNGQKENAIRIIKKLFSSKSKRLSTEEEAEARVDYISDQLGIELKEVIEILTKLREEKILADTKDLTAFIKKRSNTNHSLSIINSHILIEDILLKALETNKKRFNLKELNEQANLKETSIKKFKNIINFWSIKKWVERKRVDSSNHIALVPRIPVLDLQKKTKKLQSLSKIIIQYLHTKANQYPSTELEVLVEFSILELIECSEKDTGFFDDSITAYDIEDTLFYLSKIEAIKIEGGFLVFYKRIQIEKKENNRIQYKKENYEKLDLYYKNKTQQIHIVGKYAKMMIEDKNKAIQFVKDYFSKPYSEFLKTYFQGTHSKEINQVITTSKFKELFGGLSEQQLEIINDKENDFIVVTAGAGSGKTKVLAHKLASLLLMEDIKKEQLLMLTFSRAAATEFKIRLMQIIGNSAHFVEIKTFHSYCFDLLGKVGNTIESESVIIDAVSAIKSELVEKHHITKSVLVIDEAQDIDDKQYALINILIEKNEGIRVILVGDDDQNVFGFRGSDSKFMKDFIVKHNAAKYELIHNYRSYKNLVEYSNNFVQTISNRLKTKSIIAFNQQNGIIKLTSYQNPNFLEGLILDIEKSKVSGTTCILTQTNYEASMIKGLLVRKGISVKIIQNNDGFELKNLYELHFFTTTLFASNESPVIEPKVWTEAKEKFRKKFLKSIHFNLCKKIIGMFEKTNQLKKYKTDWVTYLKESKIEDFVSADDNTIIISTIHKAKGKEFDNVFLYLENFEIDSSEEKKRLLYVAFTRPKKRLHIHYNGNFLENIKADKLERIYDDSIYADPKYISYLISLKDIQLDYSYFVPSRIAPLSSGDNLTILEDGLGNRKNEKILKFSLKLKKELEMYANKGYRIKEAKVNFIVYWKNKDKLEEVKTVLPEIVLERA
jgi:ATP-dependent DNA helicase RecQ